MATKTGSATLNAWIIGTRWRHHRLHDHFGAESDSFIMLSQRIGPYEEQTSVHAVLADLVARLLALETTSRGRGTFSFDAVIDRHVFTLNAVLFRAGSTHTLTLDAWLQRGGRFSLNAVIKGGGTFALNAILV